MLRFRNFQEEKTPLSLPLQSSFLLHLPAGVLSSALLLLHGAAPARERDAELPESSEGGKESVGAASSPPALTVTVCSASRCWLPAHAPQCTRCLSLTCCMPLQGVRSVNLLLGGKTCGLRHKTLCIGYTMKSDK